MSKTHRPRRRAAADLTRETDALSSTLAGGVSHSSGAVQPSSASNEGLAASEAVETASYVDGPMMQTLYPVVRRGTLVRAGNSKTKEACALNFEQGEAALKLIEKRKDEFQAAIVEAIRASAAEQGLTYEDYQTGGLTPADRNRALGAIYDFSEFAFRLNGAVVVARACVTLCVLTAADADGHRARGELPLSKFWIRFILATHPESPRPDRLAIDLDLSVLKVFDERCTLFSNRAMAAIAPLYGKVVEEVVGYEIDLDIESRGAFAVLALGTMYGDFPEVFQAARAGEPMAEMLQRDEMASAKLLANMALSTLTEAEVQPDLQEVDLAAVLGKDAGLVLYEDMDAYTGLFVAHYGEGLARFVGLTRMPKAAEKEFDLKTLGKVHGYSSNQVSGGLIQQYALSF